MNSSRSTVLLGFIILLLALPFPILSADSEEQAFTPPAGSAERKLILDALRGEILKLHGLQVVFVVNHLKVKDGWAWLAVQPQSPDANSRYEDVTALLRKRGSAWEVAEVGGGEDNDGPLPGDPDYFKLLKQRFPDMPMDILPFGGEGKPAPSHGGKNILDWYQSIPEELLDGSRYQITKRDDVYVSRSCVDYKIKPTVDIGNGYLKIVDNGTGGGSISQELAFLQTDKGHDIIAVNLVQHDGLGPAGKLRFYALDNQWTDVTSDILPEVNLSHFLDEKYFSEFGQHMDMHPEGIVFVYRLDINGAPIFAHIDLERFAYTFSSASKAKELVKNIKYEDIRLVWDKEKNRLRFSGKGFFDGVKQQELLERIDARK